MAFNQISDNRYEEILVRDNDPQLEEWRELTASLPILQEEIKKAKTAYNEENTEENEKLVQNAMSKYGNNRHRKMKIEERLYLANKDVL